ncbi:Riboflavin synthase alpha chain [Rickettsiales bacterium Ac37b]|nr:Riboflavin synthase alpha chain [Rickettsiales bacterium Ac37b]
MFSGIVEATGLITNIIKNNTDITMSISSTLSQELKRGDSIAVNGCCLTVINIDQNSFSVQIIKETIDKTNLKYLNINSLVNLEQSITLNQRIGGHFVQGHITNVAKITSIKQMGDSKLVYFNYPKELTPYIIHKGYITIDGMSITVIDITDSLFSVAFIPYTISHTIVNLYTLGTLVNLEIDIIGKYIEKFINHIKIGTQNG